MGLLPQTPARACAETALREGAACYRVRDDGVPSMYFTVDAAGTVLSVNHFDANYLGFSPDALVGHACCKYSS